MTTLLEAVANHCDTSYLAGLAQQVAQQFVRSMPAMAITDLTRHVMVAGPSTIPYLQRSAGDALIAAIKDRGEKPALIHALRTLPQQFAFWKWYVDGRCGNVAQSMPGSSVFESGVAIEIDDANEWVDVLRLHDWHWCGPQDSAHFNYHGPQDPAFHCNSIWTFQLVWNRHHPDDTLQPLGVLSLDTLAKLEQSPAAGF